jgi:subtilisin family serine protease
MRRLTLIAASAGILAACADQPAPTAVSEPAPAPLLAAGPQDQSLRDRYIVVFKPSVRDVDATVDGLVREHGIGQVHYRYRAAIQGFAATLPPQALEGLRRSPLVEFIEADGLAYAIGTQSNPPSWGLDRVDQRDLPLNSSYGYQNEGQGVEAYILDTGIRYTHQEFVPAGRAVSGRDFVSNDAFSEDCHGHGTHVAGTVGGTTTGIAKQVKLFGVRVLDCSGSGSYSGITAAVDWVTQEKLARPAVPMVGNMSLGGGKSTTLNSAVDNSVTKGVVWAVAAGNSNANACNYSPASAASALTVGATTSTDARASYSNYGSCLDVFAPGSSIYSSTYNSDNTYASWNGTSMASPHVAGVAALYLSANPTASAATANSAITGGATTGKVTSLGTGSPNRLLYSLLAGGTVEPPSPPDAPTSLAASAQSSSAILLTWTDNADNEDAYLVERSTDNNAFSQIASLGAGTTAYTATGLSAGTIYEFRVRASNAGGTSAYSNTASATTLTATVVGVTSLTGTSASVNGRFWRATVVATVLNASNVAVAGATVSGSFTAGGSGSCTTGSNGQCSITSGNINKNTGSTTFTVGGVSGTGLTWNGDEKQVSVSKP